MKNFLPVFLLFFFCLSGAPRASALSTLAASMKAGEWKELTTGNILPVLTNTGGSSNMIFGYSESMRWDPVTKRAYYLGSDHGGNFNESYRFVCYDENTNAWVRLTQPPWSVSPPGSYYDAHGYDHTALSVEGRKLYRRPYNSITLHVYDIPTASWSDVPAAPNTGSTCCDAVDFFPELGGLVWSRGTNSVLFYHETSQKWTNLGSNVGLASTWMVAEYNPVHQLMILGSSTKGLYKLSSQGQLTKLQNMAVGVYDGGAWNGIVTVDPVGGDYLVFTASARQFHIYNVLTDTWNLAPNQPTPSMVDGGVAVTPVGTYGVTMFTHCQRYGQNCRVLLYKHTNGTGTAEEAAVKFSASGNLTASPNPFRGRVTITAPEAVGMAIYNLQGKKVAGELNSQENEFHWNAGTLPAGIYIAQGAAAGKTYRQRLILMK